jgi:hypothetical protein
LGAGEFFVLLREDRECDRYLLRGQWAHARAVWEGWQHFVRDWQEIRALRQTLQNSRTQTDAQLFALHSQIPPPLVWQGFPELTWDVIATQYEPLMFDGRTRPMPEFSATQDNPSAGDYNDAIKNGWAGVHILIANTQ